MDYLGDFDLGQWATFAIVDDVDEGLMRIILIGRSSPTTMRATLRYCVFDEDLRNHGPRHLSLFDLDMLRLFLRQRFAEIIEPYLPPPPTSLSA